MIKCINPFKNKFIFKIQDIKKNLRRINNSGCGFRNYLKKKKLHNLKNEKKNIAYENKQNTVPYEKFSKLGL